LHFTCCCYTWFLSCRAYPFSFHVWLIDCRLSDGWCARKINFTFCHTRLTFVWFLAATHFYFFFVIFILRLIHPLFCYMKFLYHSYSFNSIYRAFISIFGHCLPCLLNDCCGSLPKRLHFYSFVTFLTHFRLSHKIFIILTIILIIWHGRRSMRK
jgi:hypothetical protein